MNKWRDIWNKDERLHQIILECLIKADGFDSGAGSFSVDDWNVYVHELYQKLAIKKTDTIYDVGCGSGAFVYPLYMNHHTVGGLDYSAVLIDLANTMMSNNDFVSQEASDIDVSQSYDIVVSHSVFHYFKNLAYAKDVIRKMFEKARCKIAIFDINDISKKEEYHAIRMAGISKEEYHEKYKGLEHMFYAKEWFEDMAKELNVKITIFDQSFKGYTNSKLRFNVILEKEI